MNNQFDDIIQEAWLMWMPQYDWRIGWGQIMQESSFNIFAASPAGAMGLCQFMPETWNDVIRKGIVLPGTDRTDAVASIRAGAWYMRKMCDFWTTPRHPNELIKWALASYNYGAGNVLKAQEAAGGSTRFEDLLHFLPMETATYPFKIRQHVIDEFGVTPY
jgi:soluble lytic murein transglycosylase-like protein